MKGPTRLATVLAVLLATAAAGCGDSSSTTSVPIETPDPLPKLPASWRPYEDQTRGVAVGLAPGWRHGDACAAAGGGNAGRETGLVLLCAPDLLTTVSIAIDRDPDAFDVPVEAFARKAFAGLSRRRYGGSLHGGPPRPFGHPYDSVSITGRGSIAGGGFAQDVELFVLRRDELANFTVVIAANAERASASERADAERIVRTLRDEPVEHGVGNSAPAP